MKSNSIMQMKTSQFPFGLYQAQSSQARKILIKKRILYKNQKQHQLLQQKIDILKNIYHKNAINFRQIEENMDGTMDVYYNYVPYSLQGFFDECDAEVIKEIHTQLIKLVIYLAKNCLLTSFNPSRCGVMLNADDKWQVKYYLPLKEIVVTNDVVMLERSVQLFTVQALHFLDSLTQFSEGNTNCGSRNLGNRERELEEIKPEIHKVRTKIAQILKPITVASVSTEKVIHHEPSKVIIFGRVTQANKLLHRIPDNPFIQSIRNGGKEKLDNNKIPTQTQRSYQYYREVKKGKQQKSQGTQCVRKDNQIDERSQANQGNSGLAGGWESGAQTKMNPILNQ